MKKQIEKELAVLVGKPMSEMWRMTNLQSFGFGKQFKSKSKIADKKTIDVSPYYIHVDCSWRITNQKRIIIAHRDYYFPPGNQEEQAEDWSWEKKQQIR